MHPLLFFLFITHVILIPVGSKEGIPIGTLNTTAPDSDPFGLPLTSHGFWTPLSGHNVPTIQPNTVLRIGPSDKVNQADCGLVELWELPPGDSPGSLTFKEVIREPSQFRSLHDTVWIWFPTEYDVAEKRKRLAYVRIKDDRFVVKIANLVIEQISSEPVSAVTFRYSKTFDYWYRPDVARTDQVMRNGEGRIVLWNFAQGSTPGSLEKYKPGDLENSYIDIGKQCADIADVWMPYPTTNPQNRNKILLIKNVGGECQIFLIAWRAKVTWK